ncbi:MAG: SusC/RagA family TonB-linked outer membrane protein, partial [Chitinophagaceae bacterium]|nr:SusC/RagA family TonB-linked outer membrane protein [Chitinophagaceae bacterium]
MKITIVIILATCLQVSAKGFSQNRITLNLNSVEVKKALSVIEKKTDFRFLYNQSLVRELKKINIVAVNEQVTDVLEKMFHNTGISFEVLANNLIVLKESARKYAAPPITGRVVSSTGEAIIGASIEVKGSAVGTSTDPSGNFSINAPDNATLVISSVGFVTQEIKIDSGTTVLNIVMEPTTNSMDEVVVIGYGTAAKRDLTGSIVKVEGKEVADKPNTNPVASLQAKVAGLSVVNNGTPGQQPDVRIRGTVSINQVHPLYVVDGIFQDNIDYLNPNDIESMEILKDPSSLAIFGVRGASGVIAITTKRARAGQTIVNVNSTFGVKQLVDKIQLASGDQFKTILGMEAANQAADNASDTNLLHFVNYDMAKWTGNTDWVDVLTRKAFFNTNNVSVNASTDKNKFYMGVGYTTDQGIVKNVNYKRATINLGDEFKAAKFLKLGFNVNFSREELPYNGNDNFNVARQTFPIVESGTKPYFTRDPYGTIRDSAVFDLYSGLPVVQNSLSNPIMGLENKWNKIKDIQLRTVANVFVEFYFLKNFTFRSTFYGDVANEDKRVYTPLYDAYDPGAIDQSYPIFRASNLTDVKQDIYDRKTWQGDHILTYKKNFGDHSLTATAGFTHLYRFQGLTHGEVKQKAGDDPIPDDPRFWYITTQYGDPTTRIAKSDQAEGATVSGLVRALYNYKRKYYLNVSFRRDGASGINKEHSKKFQDFWAVGAAWELTQ